MDKQYTNEALMNKKPRAEIIIEVYDEDIGLRLNGDSTEILHALLFTVNKVMADNNVAEMNRLKAVIDMFSKLIECEGLNENITKRN